MNQPSPPTTVHLTAESSPSMPARSAAPAAGAPDRHAPRNARPGGGHLPESAVFSARRLWNGSSPDGQGVRHADAPRFDWSTVRGRLVEMRAPSHSGVLSLVVDLVWAAQRNEEPVAWVHGGTAPPFVVDLLAVGVDPEAIATVRLHRELDALRAAERLLRSGAFGLVVLDVMRGVTLGTTEAGRLARLADAQDCAVILMAEHPVSPAAGSLISLRAEVARQRLSDGRFMRITRVVRDKRSALEWVVQEEVDGPAGLR